MTFIGSSGFSGTAREVRVVENSSGNSTVYVDADADGVADMRIVLNNATGLDAGDFVL